MGKQKKFNSEDDTFNMKIQSKLKSKFYIKCIQNKTSMSKVLKEYIEKYIEEK